MPWVMPWLAKNPGLAVLNRYGEIPKNVPKTKPPVFGSTSTCPPSPPATSNQLLLATDRRSVPLSWLPPQSRAGIAGLVATLVNWVICNPVRWVTAALAGSTVPLRSCQSTRSEEHTSELQSQSNLVCRLLLEK